MSLSPASNHDPADIGVEADLLGQFSSSCLLRSLAWLNAPAGRIPVRPAIGIWIKQQQQAVALIEEEHSGTGRWITGGWSMALAV